MCQQCQQCQLELETKAKRRFAKVSIVSYSRPSLITQPGEGPSRGLLRDYEPLDEPSFQALAGTAGTLCCAASSARCWLVTGSGGRVPAASCHQLPGPAATSCCRVARCCCLAPALFLPCSISWKIFIHRVYFSPAGSVCGRGLSVILART